MYGSTALISQQKLPSNQLLVVLLLCALHIQITCFQRSCEQTENCEAFTIVQRNKICILRDAGHGVLEKTSRLARNGDVVSATMSCVRRAAYQSYR